MEAEVKGCVGEVEWVGEMQEVKARIEQEVEGGEAEAGE